VGVDPVPDAMSASVMTPIVFWASLAPCARETREAVPIWPQRKPLVHGPGGGDAAGDAEDQPGADGGDEDRDDRRGQARQDDLADDAVELGAARRPT
jgi:hypothetical protein